MEWSTDWNLRMRMVAALVLLVALPVAFVLTLSWTLSTVVPPIARELLGVTVTAEFRVGGWTLAGVVLAGAVVQLLVGDRLALRAAGARPVDPAEAPDLYDRLSSLSTLVDLPTPRLARIDTGAPNAFVVGRSPRSSTVVVTRGLVEILDDDELDAVLAHELAHVKNRDAALMTVAYLLPTATYLLAVGCYTLLSGMWNVIAHVGFATRSRGRRSSNREGGGQAVVAVVVIFVVTTLVSLAVAAVFWVGSMLFLRVLSQYREYAADRGGAAISGDPAALASALATIDGELERTPDRDLRELDGGLEALYLAPIDRRVFTEGLAFLASRDIFPATHPPTERRIERLRALTATQARGST